MSEEKLMGWGEPHEPKTATLTEAQLRAAYEKLVNGPMRVCGVTEPHVLHPKDHERGRGICGNCGAWITRPEGGRGG